MLTTRCQRNFAFRCKQTIRTFSFTFDYVETQTAYFVTSLNCDVAVFIGQLPSDKIDFYLVSYLIFIWS
uniref:Uncharacterized protein n=1 Tax=Pararge aegeria TaxID=116150 RepID=S4NWB8_9NEOP